MGMEKNWNIKDILGKGIRWQLGNGKKIKFWTDVWLGNENIIDRFKIKENKINFEIKVSEFIKD